ncbi:MAG: adenosylmethionine--8-amino-7-oxononanoate transaminase, partial [Holosporales bacterium]
MLIPSPLWHPFTQHAAAPPPIPVARAKGAYLYDEHDRPVLDLISSWWTNLHGHGHPALVAAMAEQAGRLDHVLFAGHVHAPALALAEGLLKAAPGFARVFFSDNGSTAVEVALKMALQYMQNKGQPRRHRLAALRHGYHGDTFGAMAAGQGSGFFTAFAKHLPPVDIVEPTAQAMAAYCAQHGDTLAGFILEPLVQGAGGMRMYPAPEVRGWCETIRAAGGLVIFDEVMTGFGRTGTLFATEQVGFTPDLLCLSKGITGGMMPLAVTLATHDVFAAFLGQDFSAAFAHGHSYTANPIACAVAVASLALLHEAKPALARIEAAHRRLLPELLAACPKLHNPRITGTIAAVDFSADEAYGSAAGHALRLRFWAAGLLLRPLNNTLYLMPPYCVTEAELEGAYGTVAGVLNAGSSS